MYIDMTDNTALTTVRESVDRSVFLLLSLTEDTMVRHDNGNESDSMIIMMIILQTLTATEIQGTYI